MQHIKKLIILLLALLSIKANAQMGVSSYSIYALGINTNQNKRISGELKTFTNRDMEELLMEADIFYNFKARNYHRFSIGVGINLGPFRGFDHIQALTVPFVLEIYPLQEFKKISLLLELSPEFIPEESLNLTYLWGIRYTFGE